MRKIFLFIFTCLCLSALAQDNQDYDDYTDSIVFVDEGMKLFSAKYTDWDGESHEGGYYWRIMKPMSPFDKITSLSVDGHLCDMTVRNSWLISPRIDLTSFTEISLLIYYTWYYTGGTCRDTLSVHYRPKSDTISFDNLNLLVSLNYDTLDDNPEKWEEIYGCRFPEMEEGNIVYAAKWDKIHVFPSIHKDNIWKVMRSHVDLSKYIGHNNIHFALRASATVRNKEELEGKYVPMPIFLKFLVKGKKNEINNIDNVNQDKPQSYSVYDIAGILMMVSDNIIDIRNYLKSGMYIVKQGCKSYKIHINH
jgi:hypothetical protein